MTSRAWRAPMLALAVGSLVWGVWMGLLRLGWVLPLPWPDQLILHGPLMVGGFLGTLIGLERAIGLAKPWAYTAPILTAGGSLWLVFGPPGAVGPLLIGAGSAVVVAVFGVVLWNELSWFGLTMMLGAVAWLWGNAEWLFGLALYRVALWWVAFLVLTIAGERLELNRLLQPTRLVRIAFNLAVAVLIAGVCLARVSPASGVRVAGAGLLGLGAWLATFDIGRRTVRFGGVTRFIALCLLSGYVWLGIAGVIALTTGVVEPGSVHDALLHAVFLGFVVSMIFGHAPIVFPAILGRPLPFRWTFYAPLALLHGSVAVRLIGDLFEEAGRWRAWGGLFNAVALAAFLVNAVATIAFAPRSSV